MENIRIFTNVSEMVKKENKFIKEVARTGQFVDANGTEVDITTDFLNELVINFKSSSDKVFVPLNHPKMEKDAKGYYYYNDPLKNTGWVEDLWVEGGSLYAKFNITEPAIAEKIMYGTIQDNSIGVKMIDNKNILEHIALTLTPGISSLSAFEPVVFSRKDVTVIPMEKTSKKTEVVKMDEKELEAKRIELEKSFADKETAVKAEFEKKNSDLSVQLEKANELLKQHEAKELEISASALVDTKKILPTQKESAIALMKADRVSFDKFVAELKAIPETNVKELAKEEVETISKEDFKKLTGKNAVAALDKLKTGKLVIA